jgi:hypothetical protein
MKPLRSSRIDLVAQRIHAFAGMPFLERILKGMFLVDSP